MSKRDIEIDETMTFVIRETGWSLEYVRSIKLSTLRRLVRELRYQKAVDEYRLLRNIGVALATWASSNKQGRRYRPEDFVGYQPTRKQINGGIKNDDNKSRNGGKTTKNPP